MATLVQRLRQIVAIESDDFFADDTLVYYLNQAQQKVVNTMIKLERLQKRSFYTLNELRETQSIPLTNAVYTAKSAGFKATTLLPFELLLAEMVFYNSTTELQEIKPTHLRDVELGNVIPTKYQGYYWFSREKRSTGTVSLAGLDYPYNDDLPFVLKANGVTIANRTLAISDPALTTATALGAWFVAGTIATGWTVTHSSGILTVTSPEYTTYDLSFEIDGTQEATGTALSDTKAINLLLHEQDATKTVVCDYINYPADVSLNDTEFRSLPSRLLNAVLYGAAVSVMTQEGVNNNGTNINAVSAMYEKELNLNAY